MCTNNLNISCLARLWGRIALVKYMRIRIHENVGRMVVAGGIRTNTATNQLKRGPRTTHTETPQANEDNRLKSCSIPPIFPLLFRPCAGRLGGLCTRHMHITIYRYLCIYSLTVSGLGLGSSHLPSLATLYSPYSCIRTASYSLLTRCSHTVAHASCSRMYACVHVPPG